ncbi:MAG TPA: sulfatase-like hydrolase/transferase [Oligoflexus sp.]|uniref:LTA synthase family protein n=1 Tax=Oligoflexus sp. TaxID=1971216 RepID=UPI002D7F40E8|nr:sulfatase-like hydrolase/transferase [Oligoflexus sp.]HET9237132.1 sulfatase-like hydrolase/transferase [Oligoflexus sp.]
MHLYLLFIYFYWLLIFAVHRLVFLSINVGAIAPPELEVTGLLQSFLQGLKLDFSMAAYTTILAWLFVLLSLPFPKKNARSAANLITAILIVAATFLAVADALLYPEWKTKINSLALSSLQRPSEVWKVTSAGQFFLGLGLAAGISLLMVFGLYRHQKRLPIHETHISLNVALLLVIWPAILGLTARGGVKAIPINVSRVYFSKDAVLNDAATNTAWFFLLDLSHNRKFLSGENPFQSMSREEARETLKKLREPTAKRPAPVSILRGKKPNLVFIVLESWSADLVAELGGEPGITPNFSALTKEGLLFTRFYANGNRSQQGIASIFSGFPALPVVTITENPGKSQTLPRFAATYGALGYQTDFFYGGQLEYGNIKAFLLNNGFKTITEDDDLPQLPQGSMGAADSVVLPAYAEHLKSLTQPFLSAFFTLSTHAPYDYPGRDLCARQGREAEYVCSATYSDAALGQFFAKVRQEPWYANTLFVLVADHSHSSYKLRENWQPGYRRIPLLLWGGALRPEFRGRIWDRVGSQVDLTTTLLHQMKMESKAYPWGNDLFDPTAPSYAYYEIGRGVGWVKSDGELVYDQENDRVLYSSFTLDQRIQAQKEAQAYLQSVVDYYLEARPGETWQLTGH